MRKKYLIFVSSSPEDLKAERRELIKGIAETGAVPITMDDFDINEINGARFIRKSIEESDYFVNLTAHKGGRESGESFSLEKEFTWAEKTGVPIISFIIDEKARWKASKKETDPLLVKGLEAFKKRLRAHAWDTWTNAAELRQKALALLVREMNLNPRQGWVRGDDAVSPATANELSRLLRENEGLKNRFLPDGKNPETGLGEPMKQSLKMLSLNKISLSFWYAPGDNWENTREFRYLRLFKLLAPELTTAKTTPEISRFLGTVLNPDLSKTVRKDYPAPTNTIKKIMADFTFLGMVKSSREEGSPGDEEAWEITGYGKEIYAAYRLRQMTRLIRKNQSA